MDRAREPMWESLPTVIQERIVDFVVVGREPNSGVVKPNALGPRLVNKMFAHVLKYHVDICQTKDPERFVRTALEQARLRSFSGASRPRVEACTADFYASIYSGVYYFCTTPVTRPPRKDAALYEALLKEMPRELSLVSPQLRKGFLHFVAQVPRSVLRTHVPWYRAQDVVSEDAPPRLRRLSTPPPSHQPRTADQPGGGEGCGGAVTFKIDHNAPLTQP